MRLLARQIIALGQPGAGKTTAIKQWLSNEVTTHTEVVKNKNGVVVLHGPRVHIYDPRGEFEEVAGFPVHRWEKAEDFEYPYLKYRTARAAALAARNLGGILVIEELMTVPREDFPMLRLLSVGRRHTDDGTKEPVVIIAATQRPVWIPREIVDLSDEIWIFRLLSKDDIGVVKHLLTDDQAKLIPKLGVGEKIVVDLRRIA